MKLQWFCKDEVYNPVDTPEYHGFIYVLIYEDEDIHETDLDALLNQALNHKDYRLAIRYYYLSILKTAEAWERFEKIILVHAVPVADELNYSDLIEQFAKEHPEQFQFISIVSREDHEGSLKGRIPALIDNGELEAEAGLANKRLSVREKQVVKLVAEGFKTKDIAEKLEISDRTVSKHRENLMTKMGMTSTAELTNYANESGLTKVGLEEIE